MTSPFTKLTTRLALATLLPLVPLVAAHAGPATGSGQPISNQQPSLGLNYIVRVQSSTNIADLGQVVLFAGNFAPAGWAFANGQQLTVIANEVLFSQIGATYGGNGTNTFALPNLNGRVAVGAGQGAGLTNQPLGGTAGVNSQTLTATELPPFGGASGIATGSQPVKLGQPSLALNYGIVTQGFFPSQQGGPLAGGPFIGQIVTYAGAPPPGVTPANGQTVSISQNQALFAILGNTYGGNGVNTFSLPDLQGRAPIGAGQAGGLVGETLGEKAGAQQTNLSTAQLPPNLLTLANGTSGAVGGGQAFSIMQPSLALHAIIDLSGSFPSQSNPGAGSAPFLGEITWFAGDYAPAGWAFADGQLLPISQYAALFAILGNTYGGNGVFNFALPNLDDRFAVGTGSGITLGEQFGFDTDTLSYAQLPVGYPSALPVTNTVPEPPAIALITIGIAGVLLIRRSARPPLNRVRALAAGHGTH